MQAIIFEEEDMDSSENVEFKNPYAVNQEDQISDCRTIEVGDNDDTWSAN